MLTPGRKVVGSPVRLAANFQDEDRTDIDPATVTVKLLSPGGTQSSWVYGTDAELVKVNTGDYYIDVTPDASGRWAFRWESTGTDKTIKFNGTFVVEYDPFEEGAMDAYNS